MNCGSCSAICQVNNTGICLGCQRGFTNYPQEDAWVNSDERKKLKLKERKEEIENELHHSTSADTSTPLKRTVGKGVRTPHAKRKKTSPSIKPI